MKISIDLPDKVFKVRRRENSKPEHSIKRSGKNKTGVYVFGPSFFRIKILSGSS